jgi:hypothetical protein
MDIAELTFHHPSIAHDLAVKVKPDQIVWSYGLNTKNYPTFGGEVVQILSMYVGDLNIKGMVGTYKEIEEIYSWFISYMQNATQGRKGEESYDTRPVIMNYPHRQWTFEIYPKSIPGFRYGKDVVAPTWELTAAVSEYSDSFKDSILSQEMFAGEAQAGGFEPFGTVTGGFDYKENNPWSGPTDADTTKKENKKIADHYNNLIKSYLEKDWSSIEADYSVPNTPKDSKQTKTS